ncbi:uncharacterized protein L969DRAFT_94622 [Mixia osmundae IAM 14324]|uniref:Uncharacterized protein n=1 Tax=Mixia osmundae (strain CBS 9802 / IAM 14324 / JCM 22182 / KY 12970) TaxID=764103 RepID=G7DVZ1_MIXOS|nr:uncharacterized protein L969DRAFT_94622 [Mixia osmundae IAM 14324]KEI39567.1 hypothetical protein L969DRAFT_94622 [Mixia osmundae IAM 14324]GAA94751.1 hypothetical protein E5Q_01405 [Mixia osmundae IAM 14324]
MASGGTRTTCSVASYVTSLVATTSTSTTTIYETSTSVSTSIYASTGIIVAGTEWVAYAGCANFYLAYHPEGPYANGMGTAPPAGDPSYSTTGSDPDDDGTAEAGTIYEYPICSSCCLSLYYNYAESSCAGRYDICGACRYDGIPGIRKRHLAAVQGAYEPSKPKLLRRQAEPTIYATTSMYCDPGSSYVVSSTSQSTVYATTMLLTTSVSTADFTTSTISYATVASTSTSVSTISSCSTSIEPTPPPVTSSSSTTITSTTTTSTSSSSSSSTIPTSSSTSTSSSSTTSSASTSTTSSARSSSTSTSSTDGPVTSTTSTVSTSSSPTSPSTTSITSTSSATSAVPSSAPGTASSESAADNTNAVIASASTTTSTAADPPSVVSTSSSATPLPVIVIVPSGSTEEPFSITPGATPSTAPSSSQASPLPTQRTAVFTALEPTLTAGQAATVGATAPNGDVTSFVVSVAPDGMSTYIPLFTPGPAASNAKIAPAVVNSGIPLVNTASQPGNDHMIAKIVAPSVIGAVALAAVIGLLAWKGVSKIPFFKSLFSGKAIGHAPPMSASSPFMHGIVNAQVQTQTHEVAKKANHDHNRPSFELDGSPTKICASFLTQHSIDYTAADWDAEMARAHKTGFDAFAMHVDTLDELDSLYLATEAAARHGHFKFYLSLDSRVLRHREAVLLLLDKMIDADAILTHGSFLHSSTMRGNRPIVAARPPRHETPASCKKLGERIAALEKSAIARQIELHFIHPHPFNARKLDKAVKQRYQEASALNDVLQKANNLYGLTSGNNLTIVLDLIGKSAPALPGSDIFGHVAYAADKLMSFGKDFMLPISMMELSHGEDLDNTQHGPEAYLKSWDAAKQLEPSFVVLDAWNDYHASKYLAPAPAHVVARHPDIGGHAVDESLVNMTSWFIANFREESSKEEKKDRSHDVVVIGYRTRPRDTSGETTSSHSKRKVRQATAWLDQVFIVSRLEQTGFSVIVEIEGDDILHRPLGSDFSKETIAVCTNKPIRVALVRQGAVIAQGGLGPMLTHHSKSEKYHWRFECFTTHQDETAAGGEMMDSHAIIDNGSDTSDLIRLY